VTMARVSLGPTHVQGLLTRYSEKDALNVVKAFCMKHHLLWRDGGRLGDEERLTATAASI
jgi:hypothetical protein